MTDSKSCTFCGVPSIGDYCANCQKFLDVVADQREYMWDLGEGHVRRLLAHYQAQILGLELILKMEYDL